MFFFSWSLKDSSLLVPSPLTLNMVSSVRKTTTRRRRRRRARRTQTPAIRVIAVETKPQDAFNNQPQNGAVPDEHQEDNIHERDDIVQEDGQCPHTQPVPPPCPIPAILMPTNIMSQAIITVIYRDYMTLLLQDDVIYLYYNNECICNIPNFGCLLETYMSCYGPGREQFYKVEKPNLLRLENMWLITKRACLFVKSRGKRNGKMLTMGIYNFSKCQPLFFDITFCDIKTVFDIFKIDCLLHGIKFCVPLDDVVVE